MISTMASNNGKPEKLSQQSDPLSRIFLMRFKNIVREQATMTTRYIREKTIFSKISSMDRMVATKLVPAAVICIMVSLKAMYRDTLINRSISQYLTTILSIFVWCDLLVNMISYKPFYARTVLVISLFGELLLML